MATELLTVGLTVYGEFPNTWFTLQSLRATHGGGFAVLVLDASPRGCPDTRAAALAAGGRYFHRPDLCHTAAGRDQLVRLADTPWAVVMDPHVLVEPGGLAALGRLAAAGGHDRDLVAGPLVYDDGRTLNTHWRANGPGRLWGEWDRDARGADPRAGPFDIPMHGLGLFAAHTDHWPGFHPLHRGFGAEEGYLHELYRRAGGRCLCLPALRWRHQFRGPANPAPYPRPPLDHARNLILHHRELGLDTPETVAAIHTQFAHGLPDTRWADLRASVAALQPAGRPFPRPARQRLLGVWYSNNSAPGLLLRDSLKTIRAAADSSRHDVTVVTCPWRPVPGNPFPEVLADLQGASGHAAILRQIQQCLRAGEGVARDGRFRWDAVVFLEHDVLYPPDHFDAIGDAFAFDPDAPVVSNLNYEGLNATGWLAVKERHEPLHQLALRYGFALANLSRAEADCGRQGWAYLEPDHDADRSRWLRLPFDPGRMPAVHVNHAAGRLTSHGEVCYAADADGRTVHAHWGPAGDWWPGGGEGVTGEARPGCGPCRAAAEAAGPQTVGELYDRAAAGPSDFAAHMPALRGLAADAAHVTEVSGWNKPALYALAAGCEGPVVSYCTPPHPKPAYAELGRLLGDRFRGEVVHPYAAEIGETDLLFLDVWHAAGPVAELLARFAPKVRGRIVLHCTGTFGDRGEDGGPGMMAGVDRFLAANPTWVVQDSRPEGHGLTVLGRLSAAAAAVVPGAGDVGRFVAAKVRQNGVLGAVRAAAVGGGAYLPLPLAGERMAVCRRCPERGGPAGDNCTVCKCYLWRVPDDVRGVGGQPGKVFVPTEACPLGKWAARPDDAVRLTGAEARALGRPTNSD